MTLIEDTPPARLPRPLDAVEIRVLGALLEKQQTTPEYYPLTLHALVAACNQKTNRDPVVELAAAEVEAALDRLREHVFVWKTGGSRAEKWEQNVERRWQLDAPGKAVMTLLLLRGEQTPGELRGRSDRLHPFATTGEVEAALEKLAAGPEPLVAELPRKPGQKETRWTHLVAGSVEGARSPAAARAARASEAAVLAAASARHDPLESRVDALEERLAAISRELSALKRKLGED
ncbi:MAG: YceH family protein [Thermoanaerobaculia bacterium]|nr:YceH family protein [Thermoanaerobaculia bacterium]